METKGTQTLDENSGDSLGSENVGYTLDDVIGGGGDKGCPALDTKKEDVDDADNNSSENPPTKTERTSRKRRIVKNLLSLNLTFLFLFTAFQALSNLQSSINCDEGLGLASLSTIYACLIVSSLFLPPIVIRYVGTKWTMAVSMVCYVLYTAANYYPQWYTLIPASALVGFAGAPLWTSKGTYLTTSSIRYAGLSGENSDVVVNRFFGLFFMFFQSSQIWGNLMSSIVLSSSDDNETESVVTYTCGASDCQETTGNETTYCNPPPRDLTNILLTVYLICGVIAIIIISVFLDQLRGAEERKKNTKPPCQLFLATVQLLKDYRMVLMIPLTIFSGLEQAFIAGDFTKSYVSCVIGVDMVGYVMICYGVSDAIFSFLVGRIAKYTGRVLLMATGAAIHLALIISLLLWEPLESQMPVYFTVAAAWGLADAIWQTEINSVYGVVFSANQEAAYSNYRLWESLGFTVSFAYSLFLCVSTKLYILTGVLGVGLLSYFVVEYKRWKEQREDQKK
ncbi:protein unc-93 homolog A-like [Ptychodera flava]|uniref:protein unc-93 homolog A-like n=1 Tax=Ptychodera flava TaxID=63121 RepID=UPI003969E235